MAITVFFLCTYLQNRKDGRMSTKVSMMFFAVHETVLETCGAVLSAFVQYVVQEGAALHANLGNETGCIQRLFASDAFLLFHGG